MGAKDWMIVFADADVPAVLRARPALDRAATERLVRALHPEADVTPAPDVTLATANPPDGTVYAAVWPGATLLCTGAVGVDRPSTVDARLLASGAGRTVHLHAMHSVVDWAAFAVWAPDGRLLRALSVAPDSGILEDVGEPLPFERPYWAGEHPAGDPEDEDEDYPLPFHPLELGEEALGALFGFFYEGPAGPADRPGADVDPDAIVLAAFTVARGRRRRFGRRRQGRGA